MKGKRLISSLLSMAMIFSLNTGMSFADEAAPVEEQPVVEEQMPEDQQVVEEVPVIEEEPVIDQEPEEVPEQETEPEQEEESENEYPAQTFTGVTPDGRIAVDIIAGEGALPKDASMRVENVNNAQIQGLVNSVIGGNAESMIAVNVIFTDKDGNEIEPLAEIIVNMRMTDFQASDQYHLVHIDQANNPDRITEDKIISINNAEATFATDVFSIYVVVGEGTQDDYARLTVNFYNGDNLIETMYVKTKDPSQDVEKILYDPGAGEAPSGQIFMGWSLEKDYTSETTPYTIQQLREYVEALDYVEGDVLDVYAMFMKGFKITYIGDKDAVLGSEFIKVDPDTESVQYTVNQAYIPDEGHNFEGWLVSEGKNNIIPAATDDQVFPNETEITIKGDVKFSVNAPEGHWLIFHENKGTYVAPQFYKLAEVTKEPTIEMLKPGYTFAGWYEDEALTREFTFGNTINDKTEVWAKWEEAPTADYTVLIWKQNVDGDGYDFAESITLSGSSGEIVDSIQESADGTYVTVDGEEKKYEGFKLKEFDQDVVIEPEGNSVVNVYYDRIEYTLRFFYARTYSYNGTRYVQVNCNNEGFLQGISSGRNLNGSLTYRGANDYQLLSGSNTWKDVNNNSIGGNPENLISSSYLAHEEVSTGTTNINSVRTDVVTGSTSSSAQNVNMTYYYIDLKVRYEQDITNLWPTPNVAFISQTMTSRNRANGSYTTITPLLQGSWVTGNNLGGTYSRVETSLFNGDDTTAYLMTYWRYESYYTYQYNVYFSALDGESGVTYKGNQYVLQNDLSYVVANGQGWGNNAPTDSGQGYYDVGTVTFPGTNIAGRVDVQNGTINVYYDRVKQNIVYHDGIYVDGNGNKLDGKSEQTLHREEVYYGESLDDYSTTGDKYYRPDDTNEYIFEGWYMDTEGRMPYEFTGNMPEHDIEVYAKWRQVQYRVFLHPNAGTDPSLNWGSESQKMNFLVSYGGKISSPTGTRSDYEFVGWFLDENYTKPFNGDAFVLNEKTVTADYDKTVDMTDPMDKWGHGATTNADVNRPWVTEKLDLYGRWRAKLEGAEGIGVIYDANGGTNEPTDSNLYKDTAATSAGSASKAQDDDHHFEYWVVQKWNGSAYEDTNVVVYPGNSFEVLKANARVEENEGSTPENPSYTYTVQLRAEYLPNEVLTPTHIYWYGNGGTTSDGQTVIKNDDLKINEAVDIQPADAFTKDGARFIGWERREEGASSGELLLKYDEETGKFYAKDDGGEFTVEATKVAADEKQPYHDLYAVWESVIYVWHSSTAEKEDISMDELEKAGYKLDLISRVDSNYYYGGWYTNYHGDDTKPYDAYAGDRQGEWVFSEAGTENGASVTVPQDVEPGTTYYLKEVPKAYLSNYTEMIYKKDTKRVINLFQMSAVDDLCYSQTGYIVVDTNHNATVVRTFIFQQDSGKTSVRRADLIFNGISNPSYLTYLDMGKLGLVTENSTFTVTPYWITPDGVQINGATRTVDMNNLEYDQVTVS